ncbi:Uncharacterized protein TCM_004830 [Theobroma cacao]|uniref:Uncharacterized protein n=1 Tax=Theobroma cacao TaxID=3641 RepID=A0A061DZ59_THECC|nr:Uncharacterized protein TCM_004830 [Theobroma cacao]
MISLKILIFRFKPIAFRIVYDLNIAADFPAMTTLWRSPKRECQSAPFRSVLSTSEPQLKFARRASPHVPK